MQATIDYLLHLADNAVVIGQRNAEWCGHGPALEEDLALANISLDHIGQARLLYQYAASLIGGGATEDTLAYFRDVDDFRNYTLLELPNHSLLVGYAKADLDFGATIVRNFLYAALMVLVWPELEKSADETLAGIAAKSMKEVTYHFHHMRDWIIRLGDGTEESHHRMQQTIDELIPYTEEFWAVGEAERLAMDAGIGIEAKSVKAAWDALIDETLAAATLERKNYTGYVPAGKHGLHSEHLGFMLAEMQSLARANPDATW